MIDNTDCGELLEGNARVTFLGLSTRFVSTVAALTGVETLAKFATLITWPTQNEQTRN